MKNFTLLACFLLIACLGKAQHFFSVTASTAGGLSSGYVSTMCTGGGCTYSLLVSVPAKARIDSILVSFDYQALGQCHLNQGGYIISLNGCKGYCQSCTIGLPGLCL